MQGEEPEDGILLRAPPRPIISPCDLPPQFQPRETSLFHLNKSPSISPPLFIAVFTLSVLVPDIFLSFYNVA